MPLPWLQDVDPAERLPDETKWEDHDELTLWKQFKLRGLGNEVKKDGDALRLLNALKDFEVEWLCGVRDKDSNGIQLPKDLAREKAFASLIRSTEKQTLQILGVEERYLPKILSSEMVIEIADATVSLGAGRQCSCDHQVGHWFERELYIPTEIADFNTEQLFVGFSTCKHILYLDHHVLRCPRRLHREAYTVQEERTGYFANAPPAFKPREFVRDQDLNNTISDKNCQLCFKEVKGSGDIQRCQVCCRVAHQKCHDFYRAHKGACEGNTGCALCCPQCRWNPSNRELKAEPLSLPAKEEPGLPGGKSEIIDDIPWTAMAKKNQMLEKKVRKLRGQLRCQRRRKPTSRTMTDRQYKRLLSKAGGRVGNHRRNKGTMCHKNAPKKEEACVKKERQADIFQDRTTPVEQTVKEEKCVKTEEESEPAVVIVKLEPRRTVKSEPVVISLL